MVSLTWQRDLVPSQVKFIELLESILVTVDHDPALKQMLTNRTGAGYWTEKMPDIKSHLDRCKALFTSENVPAEPEPPAGTNPPAGAGCQPDGQTPLEPRTLTTVEKIATGLFPQTPIDELTAWCTVAERKVKRSCDILV